MEKFEVKAYGTPSATADLRPLTIDRRLATATDIEIDILLKFLKKQRP